MTALAFDPPYYAVIFTSLRTDADSAGYEEAACRMAALAAQQPGYLGIESTRGADGVGITVSYWASLDAIRGWRAHADHRWVQDQGRTRWYERYDVRVCRVEAASSFDAPSV